MKARLTVTATRQVILPQVMLDHPGDQIEVELLPLRRAEIRSARAGNVEAFFGCLPSKGLAVSIEDMNEAIARGWAGADDDHA